MAGLVAITPAAGAVGVIAVNPGIDSHWGICTAIWGIPEYDDLDIIKYIAENHRDIFSKQDNDGRTPAHTAADSGELEIIDCDTQD